MSPKATTPKPINNALLKFLTLGFSSALGTGYSKFAPGTVGSLLGIPLGLWWIQYPGWQAMIMALVLLLISSPIVHRACEHWGEMDSSKVTFDEVLGQAITLIGLRGFFRIEGAYPPWYFILAAFLVFRILDIVKPFPARTMDRKPNGWGVMMDDVVAGIYGALVMSAVLRMYM